MDKEQQEKPKALIELDTYQICFMPDYTGFLYIEAESGEVDVNKRGKIAFKNNLTKFYIEKNLYVIIHNPINLKSVKFVEFSKQEDCPQLDANIQNQKDIISDILKKYKKE